LPLRTLAGEQNDKRVSAKEKRNWQTVDGRTSFAEAPIIIDALKTYIGEARRVAKTLPLRTLAGERNDKRVGAKEKRNWQTVDGRTSFAEAPIIIDALKTYTAEARRVAKTLPLRTLAGERKVLISAILSTHPNEISLTSNLWCPM
jgi:hypothetical protein